MIHRVSVGNCPERLRESIRQGTEDQKKTIEKLCLEGELQLANLLYFSHGDSTAESVSNTSFGKTVLLYQTPAEREHAYQTTYASAVGRQHENAAEDMIPPAILCASASIIGPFSRPGSAFLHQYRLILSLYLS